MRFRIEFSAEAEHDLALIFDHLFDSYRAFGETVEEALDHSEDRILATPRQANLTVEVPSGQALPQQLYAVHLGLFAASAVMPAPSSPDGLANALWCVQDFGPGDCHGGIGFPRFGVLAGRNDSGGATGGDGIMALAGVKCAVGCDAGDLLLGRDLVMKLGQHRRVAYVAGPRRRLREWCVDGLMCSVRTGYIECSFEHAPKPGNVLCVGAW